MSKKDKLKKVVRLLLQVITWCFAVFGLISFIICMVSLNNYTKQEKLTSGEGEQENKQVITTYGDYDIYWFDEFIFTFLGSSSRIAPLSENVGYYNFVRDIQNCFYVPYEYVNFGANVPTWDTTRVVNIRSFQYYVSSRTEESSTHVVTYQLTYYFYNNADAPIQSAELFQFNVWFHQTPYSSLNVDYFTYEIITSNGGITIQNKDVYVFCKNGGDARLGLTGNNYNVGYRNGYLQGKEEGYELGYNTGYNTGITGVNSNPFDLLSNAFRSIASILDINIIPGLSIGVLIFAPLIVLIIITIFKLLRD